MRNLILIVIAALTITSCGTIQWSTHEGFKKEDYANNSLSKNENYVLANEWMVEAFNNAESVIQFSDKEAGIVKGKYVLSSGNSSGYYTYDKVSAIITVRVKNNQSKIEIDLSGANLGKYIATGVYAGGPVDGIGFTGDQARSQVDLLITSFKTRLSEGM